MPEFTIAHGRPEDRIHTWLLAAVVKHLTENFRSYETHNQIAAVRLAAPMLELDLHDKRLCPVHSWLIPVYMLSTAEGWLRLGYGPQVPDNALVLKIGGSSLSK